MADESIEAGKNGAYICKDCNQVVVFEHDVEECDEYQRLYGGKE